MAHMVETMFSANRIVPWHGLGEIIEEAPDSKEAIKVAGLDWEVRKRPVYVDGKVVDDTYANVRSDNGTVLGIVTGRYQIVQNHEAFTFTDSLVADGEMRYETAGSLRDGRQIWLLGKMKKEWSILGDKVDPYILFTNTHDGTGAVRVLMTPIRVVCNNTLNLAMRNASRAWGARHIGDISAKLHEAQRTLGLATHYMERLDEEAHKLVDIKLSNNTIKEIVYELYPINEGDGERRVANIQRKREGLLHALKADDLKKFEGTGWQVIGAVSDFVSHYEIGRQPTRERKFEKIVNGDDVFDKAYELLRQAA